MNAVFADTSFYVALVTPRDHHHAAAAEFARGYNGRVVTSDFVLLEVANFLAATRARRLCNDLFTALAADQRTRIIPATRSLFRDGLDLYRARRDKQWSLTDCTSFALMRRQRLSQALTLDHHFAQAGFDVLLR